MKPYFLLICLLAVSSASFAQQSAQRTHTRDSLANEVQRLQDTVVALRKRASQQDTIVESMHHMVQFLSAARGNDTAGLAGWKRAYKLEMNRFDSTLERLDTCTGLLFKASYKLDAILKEP